MPDPQSPFQAAPDPDPTGLRMDSRWQALTRLKTISTKRLITSKWTSWHATCSMTCKQPQTTLVRGCGGLTAWLSHLAKSDPGTHLQESILSIQFQAFVITCFQHEIDVERHYPSILCDIYSPLCLISQFDNDTRGASQFALKTGEADTTHAGN